MGNDKLILDNQLCFAIYAGTRQITKIYKPYLHKLGLTYTQYISLLVLWEEDKITVKKLGKKLYLDSGTLTPLLKKLDALGLIKTTRDNIDKRNVLISLTENGKILKEKAYEIPNKVFSHTGLSLENAISLREDLKRMLNNID